MLKYIMLLSSVLGVTEITFIFILLSSFTLKVDGNKAYGNCTDSEKKTRCCVNYYYTNGTCTKCPKGTFGENCSRQCPDNMYGESCAKRCDCKANQVCNRVDGCIDSPGTCGNNSYEMICCINYILKDGYCKECPNGTYSKNCSEDCPPGKYGLLCEGICNCDAKKCDKAVGCSKKDSESDFQTTGEIYWIIWINPAVIGIVIFIIICIYRRSQPRKRQFVDIPMYQHEINANTSDNYDHMADITMAKNGETIDSRKLRATSPATITREVGTSDEIPDTGEYHTLNLRVFDYEEPIKHEQLKRSRSENSSLYFDCPARQIISGIDDNNGSSCRRGSSLRQIRSTDDHIHESDEQKLTRERHFVPENYVSKSVNNSEPTFDDFDLNNPATLERKNMVPQRQLFLNELSSHLFNLQKY